MCDRYNGLLIKLKLENLLWPRTDIFEANLNCRRCFPHGIYLSLNKEDLAKGTSFCPPPRWWDGKPYVSHPSCFCGKERTIVISNPYNQKTLFPTTINIDTTAAHFFLLLLQSIRKSAVISFLEYSTVVGFKILMMMMMMMMMM